jgi:hypothetical protein
VILSDPDRLSGDRARLPVHTNYRCGRDPARVSAGELLRRMVRVDRPDELTERRLTYDSDVSAG